MSRWKPKVTKDDVLKLYKKHPTLRSTKMAEMLKCKPSYVRATLARAGIELAHSSVKRVSKSGIMLSKKSLTAEQD